MHGGLSPDLRSLSELRALKRQIIVPEQGLLCDLLWSDPDPETALWERSERGISFTFGKAALARFLEDNNLDLVCRAHQVVQDGYLFFGDKQLVTVFSATNYCGEFDNSGALMSIDEDLVCSFQILRPQLKTNRVISNH